MSQRGIFAACAACWRTLTEAKRLAWTKVAKRYQSARRGRTRGPLTGSQLSSKLNCVLATFGQDQIDDPVARPVFPTCPVTNIVITNTGGVVALKLTVPTNPGDATILRGCAPMSQGVEVPGPAYNR